MKKRYKQWYGSGNSSSNTNPQIQDNHQTTTKKIILKKKNKNDDPKDLLEQLEKIRRRLWRKQKEENENLIKNSNYSDVLNKLIWRNIS
ncbi:hypothetical protein HYD44_02005 [Mycoplasmopsis bovis]|nr:hypothetical protein [Mycoplasmopsis bovis]QQH83765.1 hypothetical protein HYD44_02005 [Mycoplasmopsis bovis]